MGSEASRDRESRPDEPRDELSAESPDEPPDDSAASIPWQQRFYQNIWLWAVAAILFWLFSYVVWGWVDLMLLPEG